MQHATPIRLEALVKRGIVGLRKAFTSEPGGLPWSALRRPIESQPNAAEPWKICPVGTHAILTSDSTSRAGFGLD